MSPYKLEQVTTAIKNLSVGSTVVVTVVISTGVRLDVAYPLGARLREAGIAHTYRFGTLTCQEQPFGRAIVANYLTTSCTEVLRWEDLLFDKKLVEFLQQ